MTTTEQSVVDVPDGAPDGPDTVEHAGQTPDVEQPYLDLGLQQDEYEKIRKILGRRPTQSELAMYSIMWSEHCSYKSSKVHLRQFAEKAPPADYLMAGMGANAGVIRVTEHLAVTFKVESHNHPSFVEPYQGAATGVGGIVRDILAMGARPVAIMDPLRFGAADHPDTARVLPGVVAGVGGYGNCLGLPNIGGELGFDPCYQGNPLLNALCVGVLPTHRLQNKAAAGPGNAVILLGAKTGRDGIGGVSVLASATFDAESSARRPSVQVGDPFTEKLLIEACLELYAAELVVGIQDLGGAGLTCALSETAAAGNTGMTVTLENVPLREPSMAPHEILASESQERMLLVVAPEKVNVVLAVAERWGVLGTVIGEVTDSGRLVVNWRGQTVVDLPPGSLADDGPVYARPMREPNDLPLLLADRAETLPRPSGPDELRALLLRLIASPNLCDKSWVTEQYDRYVLGNTVLAQPEDAGIVRIDEESGLGIAISVDGNGRYTRLDPYRGAQLALAEAYRNVAVTGAVPLAVTDCLNFGSPEDPQVMWQFAEAVRGLADGCAALGIPVTGGNVSFYNQTGAVAINPTPIVGVLGVLANVADRVPLGLRNEGDSLILLGETRTELSGSEWAWVEYQHLGGKPPVVDFEREKALAAVIAAAAERGHLSAAHDLSEGGLAQTLVEACLRHGVGAAVALPDGTDPFVSLFSESTGRALVAVPRGHDKAFTALVEEHAVPWTPLGVVATRSGRLDIRGLFSIPLPELRTAFSSTLPALFGGSATPTEEEPPALALVEAVELAEVSAAEQEAVELGMVVEMEVVTAPAHAAPDLEADEPTPAEDVAGPVHVAPDLVAEDVDSAAPAEGGPDPVAEDVAGPVHVAPDPVAEDVAGPVHVAPDLVAEDVDPAGVTGTVPEDLVDPAPEAGPQAASPATGSESIGQDPADPADRPSDPAKDDSTEDDTPAAG